MSVQQQPEEEPIVSVIEPVERPPMYTADILKDFNPEDYEPGLSYAFLKELSRLVAERKAK